MPPTAASSAPWRIPAHVVHTEMGDEGVLLDLSTKQYYSLNRTGAVIWRLAAEGLGHEDIARAVSARFEVSEQEANAHVASFLTELRSNGLLVSEHEAQ